jgi:WD40 repeat protein
LSTEAAPQSAEFPSEHSTASSQSGFIFDAFISYSHAADRKLASALQESLQRFAKPWYVRRAVRLFRDNTNLSATPHLWPSIERALSQSHYFMLLASTQSAQSSWVQRELRWWLTNRSEETLLVVFTQGMIAWSEAAKDFDWNRTDALPDMLQGVFADEPLWVDLSWATADGDFSQRPAFQDAVASVAAALRDRKKEDLVGEDVRQHRRAVRLARAAVAGLTTLVLALAAAATLALNQRDTAITQQQIATSRQLAAQSATRLPDRLDLALLLAHQAFRTRDTLEARGSLLGAQEFSPHLKAFLQGHGGIVDSVAFSPDGSLVAGAGWDGSLQLWDTRTGRLVGPALTTSLVDSDEADSPTDVRNAVAFSPDGKRVASTGLDNSVYIWDVGSRTLVMPPLTGHASVVGAVTFSHNGVLMASGSWDSTVRFWNAQTGQPESEPLEGFEMPVTSVAFSPADDLLAAASIDGSLRIWDVAQRRLVGRVPSKTVASGVTNSLAFSPDGSLLASSGASGEIVLWDVANKREAKDSPLTGHKGAVMGLAFSSDGKRLASAGWDETLREWDVDHRTPIGTALTGHSGVLKSVAFSPDGQTIATSSVDGSVRLWDANQEPPLSVALTGHTNIVNTAVFSPDGRLVASGSNDQNIVLWDVPTQRSVAVLEGHTGTVDSVSFNRTGDLIASGSEDGSIRLWDTAGTQVANLGIANMEGVKSVAFSPDGSLLVSGGRDAFLRSSPRPGLDAFQAGGSVRIWDVASRQPIGGPLQGHTSNVNAVAFRPDGTLIASGSSDKSIRFWDVRSQTQVGKALLATDGVKAIAFSPDGSLLASGTDDGIVQLWSVAGQVTAAAPLTGHKGGVDAVAFSPDGALLASTGSDGTIRLWDVAHNEPFAAPIKGGTSTLAFAPDGRAIVSAGSGGSVRVWDISVESWAARACALANRELTREEWIQFIGPDAPYTASCQSGS